MGSKPGWLKRQSKILPLSHEEASVSEVNLNGYESQLILFTYICLTATESSIHIKSLAYTLMATQLLYSLESSTLHLKEENSSRFYSWWLQQTAVKKVCSIAFFLVFSFFVAIKRLVFLRPLQLAYVEKVHPPLLGDDGGVDIVGLLYFHISQIADWLGYDMSRGVMHLCWTCLETCLELPKSRDLISLYSDLMDQFEGSRKFDDHQWEQ